MSAMGRFLTYTSGLILQAVASDLRYGFEIMDATGLPSGTVYPALRALERRGLVESEWEEEDVAHAAGRPARKYYSLTAAGAGALSELVQRFRGLAHAVPAPSGTP